MLRAAVALAAVLPIVACGSSGPAHTTTVAKPGSTGAKHTPVKPIAAPTTFGETVGVAGHQGPPSASVTVKTGDLIVLTTKVPGAASAPPTTVRLTIDKGPGPMIHITANGGPGQQSQATAMSAGGKPITLVLPRWICNTPPAATFCPALTAKSTASAYHLSFATKSSIPIGVAAIIGPATAPAIAVSPPAGGAAPPYKLTSVVAVSRPMQTGKPQVGTSATLSPGAAVTIRTTVVGTPRSAPQTVTVTIGRGPGTTITARASVPKGQTSTVSLKSSDGKPVSLLPPRFVCYVPPAATMCPPVQAHTTPGHYSLAFAVSAPASITLSTAVPRAAH